MVAISVAQCLRSKRVLSEHIMIASHPSQQLTNASQLEALSLGVEDSERRLLTKGGMISR